MTDTIRAAIYARVSTDEQVRNGTSLDDQRQRCLAYIQSKGWEVVGEFVDEGVSGAKASRPQLDRLMAECRAGRINAVVVTKTDRFSRKQRHLLNDVEDLLALDALFVAVDDNLDLTTSMGIANFQMRGTFAELERAVIRERMMSGRLAAAKLGYWVGGPAPYGFEVVPDGSHKRLAINEVEAAMLRRAVTAIVDEGLTTWQAAALLNGLGCETRNPRNGAGRWDHINLRRVLQTAALSGTWIYARDGRKLKEHTDPVPMKVPEIISPLRHKQLLAALERTTTPAPVRNHYTLSRGRLVAQCGANFHGVYRRDRDSRQYRCWRSRPEAHERCECNRLNADDVEFVVWDEVVKLLAEPERLVMMARDFLGLRSEQMHVEREQVTDIDTKIAKLERAIQTTLVDYARQGLPASAVKAATLSLQADLDALRRHREQMQAWQEENLVESERMRKLWQLADIAHTRLTNMTPDEQMEVLDLLDVRATVTGWRKCSVCDGKGKTKGGRGGTTCTACSAMRHIATVRIEGVVYEKLLSTLQGVNVGNQTNEGQRPSTCCRP